jgi:O-antigen/teichoic acid export membrane protein
MIQDEQERFRRGYRKVVLSCTLLTYPVFATLAASAEPLIEVLFGRPWLPAAIPFQILCLAGAFRVLNTYAASVIEARGRVWAEVWRQALYAGLIVGGVVLFGSYGTVGAAIAVLLATVVMTVLMHRLLRSATPLTWRDMLAPQVPAIVLSSALAVALVAVHRAVAGTTIGAVPVLALMFASGALLYGAFLWFTPSKDVRALVDEVVSHVAPRAQAFIGQIRSRAAAR